jgi:hypothetical protein
MRGSSVPAAPHATPPVAPITAAVAHACQVPGHTALPTISDPAGDSAGSDSSDSDAEDAGTDAAPAKRSWRLRSAKGSGARAADACAPDAATGVGAGAGADDNADGGKGWFWRRKRRPTPPPVGADSAAAAALIDSLRLSSQPQGRRSADNNGPFVDGPYPAVLNLQRSISSGIPELAQSGASTPDLHGALAAANESAAPAKVRAELLLQATYA